MRTKAGTEGTTASPKGSHAIWRERTSQPQARRRVCIADSAYDLRRPGEQPPVRSTETSNKRCSLCLSRVRRTFQCARQLVRTHRASPTSPVGFAVMPRGLEHFRMDDVAVTMSHSSLEHGRRTPRRQGVRGSVTPKAKRPPGARTGGSFSPRTRGRPATDGASSLRESDTSKGPRSPPGPRSGVAPGAYRPSRSPCPRR